MKRLNEIQEVKILSNTLKRSNRKDNYKMKWKDNLKFKPFSTDSGSAFIIPKTDFVCTVHPSLLKFSSLSDDTFSRSISLDVGSFIEEFMVEQDLEKFRLKIFCTSAHGHHRFNIYMKDSAIVLHLKKTSVDLLIDKEQRLKKGEIISLFPCNSLLENISLEYLSTGVFKKQDTYQMGKRASFNELAPFLFRMGQVVPHHQSKGSHSLLNSCIESLQNKDKLLFESSIQTLLKSSYARFLVPTQGDEHCLGHKDIDSVSNVSLLRKPYQMIRDSLFREKEGSIYLLPFLFKSFYCGYLSDVKCSLGIWDIVWSKGALLRARFRAKKDGSYRLNFPKGIKSCRLRPCTNKKGIDFISSGDVPFLSDDLIIFDRFLK